MLDRPVKRTLWLLVASIILAMMAGCGGEEPSTPNPPATQAAPQKTAHEGTIVAVGDSLTAGLGVSEDEAYPALLEKRLQADGYNFKVVNAGISGETSSGARSRIEWIMTLEPGIVILETGANDGLRGIDPALTRENVAAIVDVLQKQGVVVVLAGMKMVKNMGKDFTDAFEGLYPAVAAEKGVLLVPFFLDGVAGDPALNQADGIHPTAAGYEKVTAVVYPYALEAIEKYRENAVE